MTGAMLVDAIMVKFQFVYFLVLYARRWALNLWYWTLLVTHATQYTYPLLCSIFHHYTHIIMSSLVLPNIQNIKSSIK